MEIKKLITLFLVFVIVVKANSNCSSSSKKTQNFIIRVNPKIRNREIISTIPFGSCELFTEVSDKFGYKETSINDYSFTIQLAKLKYIKIYSGHFIHAFSATYNNGSILNIGNLFNSAISKMNMINLENKEIVSVIIRTYMDINGIYGIQFLIHNLLDDSYSWTNYMGSDIGYIYNIGIYPQDYNLNISYYKILTMSGYADTSVIQTISFYFKSEMCNPYVALPPMPSPTQKLKI
jgi:hypothetical protein